MNTSAQAHVKIELLNYGTLTQIPILKSFCLLTSYHITKPGNNFINYNQAILTLDQLKFIYKIVTK